MKKSRKQVILLSLLLVLAAIFPVLASEMETETEGGSPEVTAGDNVHVDASVFDIDSIEVADASSLSVFSSKIRPEQGDTVLTNEDVSEGTVYLDREIENVFPLDFVLKEDYDEFASLVSELTGDDVMRADYVFYLDLDHAEDASYRFVIRFEDPFAEDDDIFIEGAEEAYHDAFEKRFDGGHLYGVSDGEVIEIFYEISKDDLSITFSSDFFGWYGFLFEEDDIVVEDGPDVVTEETDPEVQIETETELPISIWVDPETEIEKETEILPKFEVEIESESEDLISALTDVETQTEELTGAATEAQTEKLTEAETEAETEELAEAASEAQTEELTEAESESESEEETELLTETESEELTEVESESETEEESETETEEADVLDEEFRLTAQAESGIEVTVSGPVTSLPYPVEEISLTAEEVTDEEVLAIWNQTLEEAGANAEEAFLLDITLWHDEEEIEPIGPVQVTFAGVETGEDDEFTVFHVDTENENAEDMNAVVDEEGAVVLDTDHFSVYGGLVSVSGQDGTKITNAAKLKAFLEGDDVVGILDDSFTCNTAITVKGDKILNLNGKTITTSTASLFTVNSGTSLIITDATDVTDSIAADAAAGNKYRRQGTLNGYELTYYVTESTASGTATSETLYKHTVNFSSAGKIVSTSTGDNVIKVEGGTLSIEGGVISSNGSHAVVLSTSKGGTMNMSGGLIKGKNGGSDGAGIYMGSGNLNMSGGYIAGGSSGKGGGIYMNSGTINLTEDAVIAANKATANGAGGGIYINSGVLNLAGGTVASNWVDSGDDSNGGGIYVNSGTISMTDGYVTNNSKYGGRNNAYGQSGGGGIAYNTAKMYMSGGYITGNYSQEAGGGVYAGYWHKTDSGTRFVMSGGTIASNFARDGEGGGVRIAGGAQAVISAPSSSNVYITNNTTTTTKDWGGGGIFVQTDGTLNIMDVLITNNHAEGFGGGVASCPTGDVEAVVDKGVAIFENTADNRVVRPVGLEKTYDIAFKDQYERQQPLTDNDCRDYFCTNQSTINSQMLGGGSENWNGPGKAAGNTSNCPWYIDFDQAWHPVMALTANPTEEAKTAAKNAASVFVSGNWSHTHGGGITTNGGLGMGKTDKQEVKTSLVMKATKQVQLANGSMQTSSLKGFSFVMLNKKPTWDTENKHWTYSNSDIVKVNSVSQKKTNTSAGEITFDKITYGIAGYYTYYMVEAPITGVTGSYEQDPTLYTVGVMVTSTTTTSGTTKTTTYTIEKIELKAEANGVVKGTKEITLPSGTDKTVTVTNLTGGKTFTNKEIVSYALPETGGAGTTLYTLGGLLLMAVAEFFLLYNYKNRRKEDGASS